MDNESSEPSELAKELALWLIVFRIKEHLSQEELAKRAKMSVDEIRKLESVQFQREPRMATYQLLVTGLGLDQPGREADRRLLDNAYFALVAAHHRQGNRLTAMWRAIDRSMERPDDWPPSVRVLVLSSLALAIALSLILRTVPMTTPFSPTRPAGELPVSSAPDLHGWTVSVEQVDSESTLLLVSDPQIKQSYSLLPTRGPFPVEGEELLDPQYLPAFHAIAYIRVWNHVRSLWLAQLSVQGHHLQVAPPGPREVVANCGSCNTLTWAPSGDSLIYDGPSGLLAVSPQTRAVRQLTRGAHDAWPTCSPDGRWLVYQHAVEAGGYPVRVPAVDCVPAGDPNALMRPVIGPILGWHPAISPDGRSVAFTASPGGTGQHAWQVYSAPLTGESAPYPVSPRGCTDPTWVSTPVSATVGETIATHVTHVTDSPHAVLVYACGARLVIAPDEPHPAWQVDIGIAGSLGPRLYNPTWIPAP